MKASLSETRSPPVLRHGCYRALAPKDAPGWHEPDDHWTVPAVAHHA